MKNEKKHTLLTHLNTVICLWMLSSFSGSLSAQIIYTDIPDATPSASYPLDLNNDSIDDFLIQFDEGDKVMCKPQNNNAYAGELSGGAHLPWALAASNTICDSLATWYDSSNVGTMAWGTSIGHWVGVTDKYIALKLLVGTNTHYGWARLDFSSTSTSFTIKDYAYERSPNTCIQSGQTQLAINKNTTKYIFSTFPIPLIGTATIETNHILTNASLSICNTQGQTVKQLTSISGRSISLSRDNIPNGLYFIRIMQENKIIAIEKLIIAN